MRPASPLQFFSCSNPHFNLLHSTRHAVTNTVLRGPLTYAISDKEYAKAKIPTRKGNRAVPDGAHLPFLSIF